MHGTSLEALVQRMRDHYGFPEDSTKGFKRGKALINSALAWMFTDVPDRLLFQEWRLRLEKPVDIAGHVDAADPRVIRVTDAIDVLPQDSTQSGRWIEIQDTDTGEWVQRRVQKVTWIIGTFDAYLVMDEGWKELDVDVTARVFTLEYPYPPDLAKLHAVYYSASTGLFRPLNGLNPEQSVRMRLGAGWRSIGVPMSYGRGSTSQLPTPRVAIDGEVAVPDPDDYTVRWGYDDAGVEHRDTYVGTRYGTAGTFRYYACIGWGRRPWLHPTKGWNYLAPRYIGAPTEVSADLTTTWGGGLIRLKLPDMAYALGFGPVSDLRSFARSGFEWWIFRARVACEDPDAAGNHAWAPRVEADEVPYLLAVQDIEDNTFLDRGDYDPPDRAFPMGDYHGQPSIVLDKLPSDTKDLLLRGVRRAPILEYKTDVPPIPAELIDLILPLAMSFADGRRSNDPDKESKHFAIYKDRLRALLDREGSIGTEDATAGNRISTSTVASFPFAGSFLGGVRPV